MSAVFDLHAARGVLAFDGSGQIMYQIAYWKFHSELSAGVHDAYSKLFSLFSALRESVLNQYFIFFEHIY